MRRVLHILLAVAALLLSERVAAQYYSWGADAPARWSVVRTPDVRVIYPDSAADMAARTLFYIRNLQPDIGCGFRHGPMRVPVVLHGENFQSNGLVMFLPKRIEYLTTPAVEGYSMPWHKQLAAHEYRHAVQYNNLNRGIIRILSYPLGQQGSTVGLLFMPLWAMEGDATLFETSVSTFGRALQPSFTMGYRAMEGVGRKADGTLRRNVDRWFCGSYRHYIPDHYELGFQVCSYAWQHYGENVWDKVARFGVRNPYMFATTSIALRKFYDTSSKELFRAAFDRLERHWAALPEVAEPERVLRPLAEDNYTAYRWPQPTPDGRVVVLKSDYDVPDRFVAIEPATGREHLLAYTGNISSRPVVAGGRVWWTEYRRSTLFDQRVNSQLCYMDFDRLRPRAERKVRRALYPTAVADSVAWVEYAPEGIYSVVCGSERYAAPRGKELHGLAWDDVTEALYTIVTDDEGLYMARIDDEGLHAVTRPAYVTLSDLRAEGGRLYFGSIASGRDEVHCYDLRSGREWQMSESRYGGFDAAPAGDSILMTDYTRHGYRVVMLSGDTTCAKNEVHYAAVPENIVNPAMPKLDVVNLDTLRFTPSDSVAQAERFAAKRYRRLTHSLNVHSWMPVALNPFDAVDEHQVDMNLGVTLLSQNLLSNTEAYASYGWVRDEGSLWNLGIRYSGLGVRFDISASYGGNQLIYRLVQFDDKTSKPIYQPAPEVETYYSFDATATLPLYFQRGYHTRTLALSAGWNYSNGMVADMDAVQWSDGKIANIDKIGYNKGLNKLTFGVSFGAQVRLAYRDFAPRGGYTLSAAYTLNPTNDDFSNLVMLYGSAYLPGVAPHHSVKVAATYQTSLGGYEFPSGDTPLNYRSSRLIPRGFSSADILSHDYSACALDYQLPLCYPDGGIGSILYFKRIRLNIGGDYARFRSITARGDKWHELWSVGGDLLFDINLFRMPAAATSTVKLSLYLPSSGGVWFSAGVGLPF